MTKQDLLTDLNSPSSTLAVLQKGYLFKVPMDDDVYSALVNKLMAEANGAGKVLENVDDSLPAGTMESALAQIEEINKVVFNTILSQLHKDSYISQSIVVLQKRVNPRALTQLQHYLSQGFSFAQDPLTGDFKILNATNSLVATYPYQSIKDILQEMGVDTYDPKFYLFYAAIFPRQDIDLFRMLATFDLHFHFN